jgi:hypothetical protein
MLSLPHFAHKRNSSLPYVDNTEDGGQEKGPFSGSCRTALEEHNGKSGTFSMLSFLNCLISRVSDREEQCWGCQELLY